LPDATVFVKGMSAQILKAVLSQGVLFMSKEQFEGYALAIMVLYYRLSHGASH
jgi:adenine nucleotide transporter 17